MTPENIDELKTRIARRLFGDVAEIDGRKRELLERMDRGPDAIAALSAVDLWILQPAGAHCPLCGKWWTAPWQREYGFAGSPCDAQNCKLLPGPVRTLLRVHWGAAHRWGTRRSNLVWDPTDGTPGRWQSEGTGIHAGDYMLLGEPDRNLRLVRIESMDSGTRLLAIIPTSTVPLRAELDPLQHELFWPRPATAPQREGLH